jgi:hypothetical protein
MKKLFNTIYGFFQALSQAARATSMSRNGKWREAQDLYKD